MSTIIDRIQCYMSRSGINNNQLTVAAGLSVGLIGRAIKAKSGLNSDSIEKILYAYPDLNPNWLLTGRGSMLISSKDDDKNGKGNGKENGKACCFSESVDEENTNPNTNLSENIEKKDAYPNAKSETHDESIGMIAAEPRAIYGSAAIKLRKEQMRIPELLKEQTRTSVPFYNLPVSAGQLAVLESEVLLHTEPDGFVELSVFEGCEAVFPITGISMEPIISSGDWIGIKTIDNISRSWEFLQTGAIYLIITREERMIKFIEKATDEDFIVCKSPNYSPFKVFKGDIIKLYRVKACSKRL